MGTHSAFCGCDECIGKAAKRERDAATQPPNFDRGIWQVDKLTRYQAAIIGAYSGILCGPMGDLHQYIEKVMGRPVWTHEMGDSAVMAQVKEKAKPEFLMIVAREKK